MDFQEIPQEARSLGNCRGCKTRHYCSWLVDGREYCGDCADRERGVVKEVAAPVQATTNDGSNTTLLPFQLNPIKTTQVSIGQLETGWVLSYDGENHVFTSKTKLIDKISKLMVPEKSEDKPKDIPGFHGTMAALNDLGDL